MTPQESFTEYRPLLMSIAYRMLGSQADAEDAVQETFLRWQNASPEDVRLPRAYLTRILTHLCIDQLKSARAQREVYVGQWLPEPLVTASLPHPDGELEMAESLMMAFMVLLESLSPAERAAFLLHEVFDYDYSETAAAVGRSEANCRQMIHRARERIARRHQRYESSPEQTRKVTQQFLKAASRGDVSGLITLFSEDAVMVSDGGGKARAALHPVRGADPISRFVAGVVKKNNLVETSHQMSEINGQPAFLTFIDGKLASATILDIRGGLIRNLFIIANPDKLSRLVPQ